MGSPLEAWRARVSWAVDVLLSNDVPTNFPRRARMGDMIRFNDDIEPQAKFSMLEHMCIQLAREEWHGLVMSLRLCSGCVSHHEALAVLSAVKREDFVRKNEHNGLHAAVEWLREEIESFRP